MTLKIAFVLGGCFVGHEVWRKKRGARAWWVGVESALCASAGVCRSVALLNGNVANRVLPLDSSHTRTSYRAERKMIPYRSSVYCDRIVVHTDCTYGS